MEKCTHNNLSFFISVAAVLTVTAAVIICSATFSLAKIDFKAEFYFVCFSVEDNSISADAISSSVINLGGAGYVLEYGGEYFVTVACYYSENDAAHVRQNLLRRGLQCSVLSVEKDGYILKSRTKSRKNLYSGNLTTLQSLSKLCYDCANGLDTGEYNQASAKAILTDVEIGLKGLKNANIDNCFSSEIKRLLAECEAADNGYIYSKALRKLQIAIADTLININLY